MISVKLPLAINFASRVFSVKVRVVMFFLEEGELARVRLLKHMIDSGNAVHYHIENHHEYHNFCKELNWIYNISEPGFSPSSMELIEKIITKIKTKKEGIADTFIISGIENLKPRDVADIIQFIRETKFTMQFVLISDQNYHTLQRRISRGSLYIYRELFNEVDKVYNCPLGLHGYFSKGVLQLTPNMLR